MCLRSSRCAVHRHAQQARQIREECGARAGADPRADCASLEAQRRRARAAGPRAPPRGALARERRLYSASLQAGPACRAGPRSSPPADPPPRSFRSLSLLCLSALHCAAVQLPPPPMMMMMRLPTLMPMLLKLKLMLMRLEHKRRRASGGRRARGSSAQTLPAPTAQPSSQPSGRARGRFSPSGASCHGNSGARFARRPPLSLTRVSGGLRRLRRQSRAWRRLVWAECTCVDTATAARQRAACTWA